MTKDLICLVADKDIEYALRGLFNRPQRLGIRPIVYDIFPHPQRDPGCCNDAHHFLRPFVHSYKYALVLFDHQGSGRDAILPNTLQEQLEALLGQNGWPENKKVILLQPELETWVWSDSPQVDRCIGWEGRTPDLRSWLKQQKFVREGQIKPDAPKEALEQALQVVRKPRSSNIYRQIAETVSLNRCTDPSFLLLRQTLTSWFSPENSP
jgi:hypothetical protein